MSPMSTHTLLAAAALLGTLAAAPVAGAQGSPVSSARGLIVGAGLTGNGFKTDGDSTWAPEGDSGGGLELTLGYGWRSGLALFARFGGAGMTQDVEGGEDGEYAVGHFDLGARYAFHNPARRFQPFLEVALSGTSVVAEDAAFGDVEGAGAGLSIGGGFEYFVSPKVALGARLTLGGATMSEWKLAGQEIADYEEKGGTSRIALGVTWYPMGGK